MVLVDSSITTAAVEVISAPWGQPGTALVVIPEAASAALTGVGSIREKAIPRAKSPAHNFFIFIKYTPVKGSVNKGSVPQY